jgi:hypothetical protein
MMDRKKKIEELKKIEKEAKDEEKRCIKVQKEAKKEYTQLEKEILELSSKIDSPLPMDMGQPVEKKFLFSRKADVREVHKRESLTLKDKFLLKYHPNTTFLIEMIFSNGTCREWVLNSKKETFAYKGREYYLRYEDVKFSTSRNQYKLFFHEDFVVPIGTEIIQQGDDSFFSVKPHNLKPLINMEAVKALVSADSMNRLLKILIIIVIVLALIMVYVAYKISKFKAG